MTTADQYQEHNVRDYIEGKGVTGVYYNDSAYLFYCHGQESSESSIQYDRVYVEPIKTISTDDVPIDDINQSYSLKICNGEAGRVVADYQVCGSLAACVHQNVLYLFWSSEIPDGFLQAVKGCVYYSYCTLESPQQDGKQINPRELTSNWSTPQRIGNFEINPRGNTQADVQIAAVSNGQRLYVFGSLYHGDTHTLNVAYSDDGHVWGTELKSQDWINVKRLAACSYSTTTNETNIFLGVVTQYSNLWTARYQYDPQGTGSRLVKIEHERHDEFDGKVDYIALAAGSTAGGINGNVVQLFINGKHGNSFLEHWENNKKKEFQVNTNTWLPAENRTHGDTQYPAWKHIGAFQYFRSKDQTGEVRQEVWMVMNYWYTRCSLYVARWQSDILKLDRYKDGSGREIDYQEEEVPDQLRTLVGVIEGPPPYVLNGQSLSKGVSEVSYEFTQEKETALTSTLKFNAYAGIGADVKIQSVGFGLKVQIGAEQANKSEAKEIVAYTDKVGFDPIGAGNGNQSIYIWLKPTIQRRSYTLSDWQGKPTNGTGEPFKTYLFSVSKMTLSSERVNNLNTFLGSPNTHDIQTWKRRFTRLPDFADRSSDRSVNTVVDWDNNWREFGITQTTSRLNTNSTKISASVEEKASIFFVGFGTEFSYEITYKTTISKAIRVRLAYPPARTPEDANPGDVVEVDLRVLMFYPSENQIDQCYWIPQKEHGQRPWCLAWSLDKIATNADKQRALMQSETMAASIGKRSE